MFSSWPCSLKKIITGYSCKFKMEKLLIISKRFWGFYTKVYFFYLDLISNIYQWLNPWQRVKKSYQKVIIWGFLLILMYFIIEKRILKKQHRILFCPLIKRKMMSNKIKYLIMGSSYLKWLHLLIQKLNKKKSFKI